MVRGAGRPLLGRDWLKEIKLDWKVLQPLNSVNKLDEQLQPILEEHSEVFRDELGCCGMLKYLCRLLQMHNLVITDPVPYPTLCVQEWKLS